MDVEKIGFGCGELDVGLDVDEIGFGCGKLDVGSGCRENKIWMWRTGCRTGCG